MKYAGPVLYPACVFVTACISSCSYCTCMGKHPLWRVVHAGFFTLFLLGGFAGGVPRLVISCEPAPATLELLRRNVGACGVAQKVQSAWHCLPSTLWYSASRAVVMGLPGDISHS